MKSKGQLVVALVLFVVGLWLMAAAFTAQGSDYGRGVCDELAASGMVMWTQEQYEGWVADLTTAGLSATWTQEFTNLDDPQEARARFREWQWWGYAPERFPPSVYPGPADYFVWVYEHEFQEGLYMVLPFNLGIMPHCQCVGLATADQVNALAGLLESE